MSAFVHAFLISFAIGLVYWWLHIPFLQGYSLQAFTLTILFYLILKRFSSAKLWHLAPAAASIEMPLITFALLLLIGSTGNFNSLFYPLTYIHLFFLVLASTVPTSIAVTLLVILFHYSLTPDLSNQDISQLLSLQVIMMFFIFAKYQYQEVFREHKIIEKEHEEIARLEKDETTLQSFLGEFLLPKLEFMQQLARSLDMNQEALRGQLELIHSEVEKTLKRVKNN